jgi:DNA-binding response OmpR family regulator
MNRVRPSRSAGTAERGGSGPVAYPRRRALDPLPRIGTDPPRILVAEDDHEMRALIVHALEKEGYDVTPCPDGWRLLGYFTPYLLSVGASDTPPFDLVISDIRMPVLSGLQMLEGSRGVNGIPPFILMTAFGDEETRVIAKRAGAVAWFEKPFDIDRLVADVLRIAPLPTP